MCTNITRVTCKIRVGGGGGRREKSHETCQNPQSVNCTRSTDLRLRQDFLRQGTDCRLRQCPSVLEYRLPNEVPCRRVLSGIMIKFEVQIAEKGSTSPFWDIDSQFRQCPSADGIDYRMRQHATVEPSDDRMLHPMEPSPILTKSNILPNLLVSFLMLTDVMSNEKVIEGSLGELGIEDRDKIYALKQENTFRFTFVITVQPICNPSRSTSFIVMLPKCNRTNSNFRTKKKSTTLSHAPRLHDYTYTTVILMTN